MDKTRRSFRLSAKKIIISTLTLLPLLLATACTSSPFAPNTSTPTQTSPRSLEISFPKAPTLLCQAATQIRLSPRVIGIWPNRAPATWKLVEEKEGKVLNEGTWLPEDGSLLISFPNGDSLLAGAYAVILQTSDETQTEHTFTISDVPLQITDLNLSLTPTGPYLTHLPENTRHFYLRYTYQGTCPGAPFWAIVRYGDETICNHTVLLNEEKGTGAVACYRADGETLEPGEYKAELSLIGEAQMVIDFEVQAPPTPTPLPTATATVIPQPSCGPMFSAAGLTSEGEPYLPRELFEWYTQAVYVGSRCKDLSPGITWESLWYRDGELIHTADNTWKRGENGTIWDSVTGIPEAPFLLPGTYSVTLIILNTDPLTTQFRLIPYVPLESSE